ncbi:MAG: alcohol dehydrogenase catalytic domain-containing protein [Candidatus Doudnabacteria bacterium]|nr:alcohol dehydrogenase catalytic domain-containing protein [Candidatus Doudnabacteria bacterium]
MRALIFDKSKTDWETSRGFELVDIPEPVLDEAKNPGDANYIIMKVHYAGVCGTDKGIWSRQAFRDAILNTIEAQIKSGGNPYRIIGHEFFGEVTQVGSKVKNVKPGDFVACESHVICNQCYQCLRGQKEVCTNEKILGISHDGGFAEFAKVPAHIVWKTDTSKIRPEVAAMQEPFGNAVHAASKVDLKGKSVAIFGLGPIGMFLTLIVRGLGASSIIGVEPNPVATEMAKKLGIDYVIPLENGEKRIENSKPYSHNQEVTDEIMKITNGLGVDVSFEMAGFNSSVNNCLYATRRGGEIILFGIKQGDFVLEDYNRLIVRGFTLHAVIGRQLWKTWETTRALMENASNGVQEKLFNVILDRGHETILPIKEYTKDRFEEMMQKHPKFLIQF